MEMYKGMTFKKRNFEEAALFERCHFEECYNIGSGSRLVECIVEGSLIGEFTKVKKSLLKDTTIKGNNVFKECKIINCGVRENCLFKDCYLEDVNAGRYCEYINCEFGSFPEFLNRALIDFVIHDDDSLKLGIQILRRHFELLENPKKACQDYIRTRSCPFTKEGINPPPYLHIDAIIELDKIMQEWAKGEIDIMKTRRMKERNFILLMCKVLHLKYNPKGGEKWQRRKKY